MKLTKKLDAMDLIMNNLKDGPARYEDLVAHGKRSFGLTRELLDEEIKRLGITAHDLDGETYLTRPANLCAIWWGNRPAHYYERQRLREGGSAA